MSRVPYHVVTIPLDAGLQLHRVEVTGTYLSVLFVSPGADATLRLGNTSGDPIPLDSALSCPNCDAFGAVYITASAVPGGVIRLYLSEGPELRGSQAAISIGVVQLAASPSLLAGEAAAPDVAAAVGSGACREILVQCKAGSPASVFVGGSAAQPVEVPPGGDITVPVSDLSVLYIRSAGGVGTYAWLARS